MKITRRNFSIVTVAGWAGTFLPARALELELSRGRIIAPWRATTAIVKQGKSFEVWFDAVNGQSVESIELRSDFLSLPVKHRTTQGKWVYDEISGNTYNTQIDVQVPENVPADRYALHIKTSVGEVVSGGAVKVIREFRNEYYVLQFSDVHRWQGGYDGKHIMRKVSEILKISNIIDPEIVFETGDNMYNVIKHPEREHAYYYGFPLDGILGMNHAAGATFLVPGNHDSPSNSFTKDKNVLETARFYNRYYGLGTYNFAYGNGRYCVFNNAWGVDAVDVDGQSKRAFQWLEKAGPGNFVLGAAHIRGGEFERFDRITHVDVGICGHNHHLAPENPHPVNGTSKLFVANSVREPEHFEFNLFRVNNQTGECFPVSGNNGRCNVLQVSSREIIADSNQWKSNLELVYEAKNDGKAESNVATILNHYAFPITDAKVRFVMPKGRKYNVFGGKVEQAFDGHDYHIVDVKLDVPEDSIKTVAIESV
ncbi:hypothetical protein PDESU_01375 [Pontiella desulfatans]|uniref:Calcineurin-like phosphoesterase domain-containing protein n=1 Tax=Pontiella desulfatans TaxID=2750659 RepID=A0A6C2TZN9_PONDE|nr:metallophosphoesterase [Pontiella desulfatans]VGO12821.1 hypothetical protein PDESU_01375 [Pontiella desulfatans]